MNLPEFLLARYAEIEVVAKAATSGEWVADGTWWLEGVEHDVVFGPQRQEIAFTRPGDVDHIARQHPAYVLADLEAKRRLVDWCAPVSGSKRVPTDRPGVFDRRDVRYVNEDGEDVLRYLALPFADHPDYDVGWKP